MTEPKPSQADILREQIDAKIKENYDWSNTQLKREFKNQLLEKYPDLFSKTSLDSNFYRILNKCLIRAGKDPRSYGLKGKPPKLNTASNDMEANIRPEPQDGSVTQKEEQTQNKIQQSTPEEQTQEQPQDNAKNWENFDEEAVGAAFQALLIPIRAMYPEMESLSDQEKKSLGKLWLPAFKKYLSEHWALVGIPLLATVAIIAPKAGKARRAKLDKQKKEKKPDEEKEDKS